MLHDKLNLILEIFNHALKVRANKRSQNQNKLLKNLEVSHLAASLELQLELKFGG